jgi:hypothetical protein
MLNFRYKNKDESSLTRQDLLEIISRLWNERKELKDEINMLKAVHELYKTTGSEKQKDPFDNFKDIFGWLK